MADLESLEEDAPNHILFYTSMGWMGQIRSHRRDEVWSASIWQTFFATAMGALLKSVGLYHPTQRTHIQLKHH
jgi:hypothetical protein